MCLIDHCYPVILCPFCNISDGIDRRTVCLEWQASPPAVPLEYRQMHDQVFAAHECQGLGCLAPALANIVGVGLARKKSIQDTAPVPIYDRIGWQTAVCDARDGNRRRCRHYRH